MKLILLAVLTLGTAWAADKIAYPSFKLGAAQYVFSDFETAKYVITYNAETKKTTYVANIKFDVKEAGQVLFDVVVDPTSATLDGVKISTPLINAPDNITKFRATSAVVEVGTHELVIAGDLTRLVAYDTDGVRSAYWLNDLYDRSYLENYLPSSFEYDRVKMTFEIKIQNSDIDHSILTNGTIKSEKKNSFVVTYPEYYNTASIFFHMLPTDRIHSVEFNLKSIDGRELPGIVYYPLDKGAKPTTQGTDMLNSFRQLTESKFASLESEFGKFLHSKLVIYATDGGGFPGVAGMEYCGATMTNRRALGHELIHSYFGRGIVPANGNAGWLDEAITTWGADTNFTVNDSTIELDPSPIFKKKVHIRITNREAYGTGSFFMAQLAGKIKSRGEKPFVQFLSHLIDTKSFTPYTNEDFWNWSKEFYGYNLLDLVRKPGAKMKAAPYTHHALPGHRRFSDAELKKLL